MGHAVPAPIRRRRTITELANDDTRSGFRSHGTILQCPNRYHQDVSRRPFPCLLARIVVDDYRRIQKASKVEGETAFSRLVSVTTDLFKNEGPRALYKGITPRVLRVAPGQAIVFTVRRSYIYPDAELRVVLISIRYTSESKK